MLYKFFSIFICSLFVFCSHYAFSDQTEPKILKSLIAPESIVPLIVQNFAIGEEITCKLLSVGDNDAYLITTDQGKYVLRVYRFNKYWMQEEENYHFELEWLNFLKERDVPVSYPIQRLDGAFLGTVSSPEGQRYWALFSFAKGEVALDVASAEIYGQSVAQIHVTSNEFKTVYQKHHADLTFLVDRSVERIANNIGNQRGEDLHYLHSLAAALKAKISSIPFSGDEYGIIGGDFHGYNHHLNPQGKITHFDFDLCGYGWRAYDLAVFRWCRAKEDDAMWHTFLKGYNSVRPLSNNEMEAIPVFVVIRQLWLMGSHTTYPELVLNKEYWNEQFEWLRKLEKKYVLPQEKVLENVR